MEDKTNPSPSDDESLNDLMERAAKIKSEGKKTIETTNLLKKNEKPSN